MKILAPYIELQEINKYLCTKESNIAIADLLNEFCLVREEGLSTWIKGKIDGESNTENIVLKSYLTFFGVDTKYEENKKLINSYLSECIHVLDPTKYTQNPYNLHVKPQSFSNNTYRLVYESYPEYSVFPLDDINVIDRNYYIEKTQLGCFENEYKYLTLYKNDEIWMCITPNEINTMQNAIDKAHGNVITYGLGLGYFAFMVASKDNVKSVTIIDNDKEIINIFLTYIYPFIQNKDKIKIINADGIQYYLSSKNNYDYTFVDLWHNAEDGLPIYINFLKTTTDDSKIDFWIEKSLIALYRRCLLTVVEESIKGTNDNMYKKAKNNTDKIINEIYFKTKNIEIKKSSDLQTLLSDGSIKQLIKTK